LVGAGVLPKGDLGTSLWDCDRDTFRGYGCEWAYSYWMVCPIQRLHAWTVGPESISLRRDDQKQHRASCDGPI
jgi:hypothetical protein